MAFGEPSVRHADIRHGQASNMRQASGAFLLRDGKILLAKRSPDDALYPDVWDAVGGHAEDDEVPIETMIREVQEELGVIARDFRQIASLDEPRSLEYGEAKYNMFVVTSWDNGEPRLRGSEHVALRWVSFAEALALPLAHPRYEQLLLEICRPDTMALES